MRAVGERNWESVTRKLSAEDVRRICRLRYVDGLSAAGVGRMFGVAEETVRGYAPGRPGKIDNAALRRAFEAAGVPSTEVARRLGWVRISGPRSRRKSGADGARVRRALGLQDETSRGTRVRRRLIDAETAALIAEAIGVAPWSVGCGEDLSHLAHASQCG
jgi:hypothetical protein